ncbi:MAG: hypothetical protein R2776_01735 [Flavobacteriaceae bacterium]
MRIIILLFFWSLGINLYSQEPFLKLDAFLKENEKVDFLLPLSSTDSDKFCLFFIDSKNTINYLFDKEGSIISSYTSEIKKNTYENFLGNIFLEDSVIIFFSNNNKSKLSASSFNFNEKTTEHFEIDLQLKEERFLFQFEKNNHIYFITIKEKDSNFKIYSIDAKGSIIQKEIKNPSLEYRDTKNNTVPLFDFLKDRVNVNDDFEIPFIQGSIPPTLNITRHLMKAYPTEEGCTLVVDKSKNITYTFEFNIKDNTVNVKRFLAPFVPEGLAYGQSNSFLFKDNLFQISTNSKTMSFSIKNLETEKELKQYTITKENFFETFNLKVSKAITSKQAEKETAKLLKMINTYSIGISAKEIEQNTIQIDFGSHIANYVTPEEAGLRSALMSFGLAGGLMYALLSNNTTPNSAFLQYNKNAIIELNALLNDDLEFMEGKKKIGVFENIRLQEEKFAKNILEGVFKMNHKYYYVLYNQKENYLKINCL